MSVNGSGEDRKTKKPASDATSWSVKYANGTVAEGKSAKDKKPKPLTGLSAVEAFGHVNRLRQSGVYAAAVRS